MIFGQLFFFSLTLWRRWLRKLCEGSTGLATNRDISRASTFRFKPLIQLKNPWHTRQSIEVSGNLYIDVTTRMTWTIFRSRIPNLNLNIYHKNASWVGVYRCKLHPGRLEPTAITHLERNMIWTKSPGNHGPAANLPLGVSPLAHRNLSFLMNWCP